MVPVDTLRTDFPVTLCFQHVIELSQMKSGTVLSLERQEGRNAGGSETIKRKVSRDCRPCLVLRGHTERYLSSYSVCSQTALLKGIPSAASVLKRFMAFTP